MFSVVLNVFIMKVVLKLKLKRKLVSLGLLLTIFVGFVSSGHAVYAAKHDHELGLIEDKFDLLKSSYVDLLGSHYYDEGFDDCKDNPTFCASVFVSKKGSDHNFMMVFCSPTQLIAKYPSLEKDLKNSILTFEVEDSKGAIYRYSTKKDKQLSYLFHDDCLLLFVPSARFVAKTENVYGEVRKFDKNFKNVPGEEYIIRIYDSTGRLIIEDSFIADKDHNSMNMNAGLYLAEAYSIMRTKIAHPSEFNQDFYMHVIDKFVEDRTVNKRLNVNNDKNAVFLNEGVSLNSICDFEKEKSLKKIKTKSKEYECANKI